MVSTTTSTVAAMPGTSPSETPMTIDDVGGWPTVLGAIADGQDLTRTQAAASMATVLAGEATPSQLAGLIVGLRVKGESVDEMVGLATAMLAAAEPLELPAGAVDIVGTGGSKHRRQHALNVSTMASFVAAAAGATVCKHGNYKASSTSGSFDFLDQLGVTTGLHGPALSQCVTQTGLGFALARTYHPSMRHAGPVRSELGIPTVFNILGPLAHPGQPARQVLGTTNPESAQRMAAVRREMGCERAWIVVGADGLDELSTTGVNQVLVATPDGITEIEVRAGDVGLTEVSLDQLVGGDAAANVAIFERMMAGENGPARDIVVLNAAAGLLVAGQAETLGGGVELASAALDSGAVKAKVAEAAAWSTTVEE